jgi:hypothetical protein
MNLLEFLARCLAARKMGLIEDKRGGRLPEALWRQALPEAEFIVETIAQFEVYQAVWNYYEAEDGE